MKCQEIRSIDWERHGIYAGRSEKNPNRKVQSTRVIKRNGQSAFLSDVRKRGIVSSADHSAPKAKGHGNLEK
jgi:hypothetical protein